MKKNILFLLFIGFIPKAYSQVYIADIKVITKDSSVDISKPIILNYPDNHISIFFGDKTDKQPDFEYQLENEELSSSQKKWLKAKKNQIITYSNLYGGDYTFHLKNKTNNSQASIKFKVELLFWQNWWFIPMMFFYALIVVAIIIYLILQYRFRQQTKLQRVRDNIASDLHDDVGATLSSISFFGEMMRSKILKNAPKEEVLPLLDKLISTSKETIETMRGVVWTINPNNDNAIDFFQKLQSFGREMLSAKNIDFELLISDFGNTKLPLDIQRNFFLFYKEVINNIAKHSKATYVKATIEALEKNTGIAFKIIDNGVGFDTDEVYEGHGLKSLRKRAEELEGNLSIKSAQGKGTTVSFSFSLP